MDRAHVCGDRWRGSPRARERFVGSDSPELSPTINVLTFHPRYHSFYAFLLDEFWRRDLPRSPAAWTQFFRPRDFIYSIAMHLCDRDEHDLTRGVTGSRGRDRSPRANRRPSTPRPTTSRSPRWLRALLPLRPRGDLGLRLPRGPATAIPVDVPPRRARNLPLPFAAEIEDTAYYQTRLRPRRNRGPDRARPRVRARGVLCQPPCSRCRRRPILRELFLDEPTGDCPGSARDPAVLLDIADQTDGHVRRSDGLPPAPLLTARPTTARAMPRATDVAETHARWRLYQAREYYAFAITGMFVDLCDWGIAQAGDLRPVSLDALADHVAAGLDFDRLAVLLESPAHRTRTAARPSTNCSTGSSARRRQR